MAAVAASYAALPQSPSESDCAALPPTPPVVRSPAAELGADNALVDRMVAERRLRPMLIQRARLLDGTVVDIRAEQRIVDVAERLTPVAGEAVFDAARPAVIPGLHDHHVHLHSAAAALTSVSVGPREVHGRCRPRPACCPTAAVGEDGWIRAVGYHEAVAGPLDRTVARRGVARRAGARAAPQWRAVDAQLGRAGQGRAARPPRRPAAQRRPELVERLAAPRNRARRGQSTAGVLRRHRRHRGHPRTSASTTWSSSPRRTVAGTSCNA